MAFGPQVGGEAVAVVALSLDGVAFDGSAGAAAGFQLAGQRFQLARREQEA